MDKLLSKLEIIKRLKITGLVIAAAVLGGTVGVFGARYFLPTYTPITYISVATVTNNISPVTVPNVSGAALYEGDTLKYVHMICLDINKPIRVTLTAKWHKYSPDVTLIDDPIINKLDWPLQPGCDRPNSAMVLPDFVTPGVWAFEIEILAENGKADQKIQLISTRFTVLPK